MGKSDRAREIADQIVQRTGWEAKFCREKAGGRAQVSFRVEDVGVLCYPGTPEWEIWVGPFRTLRVTEHVDLVEAAVRVAAEERKPTKVLWEGGTDPESGAVFRVLHEGDSEFRVEGKHAEESKWKEARLEDSYDALCACLGKILAERK